MKQYIAVHIQLDGMTHRLLDTLAGLRDVLWNMQLRRHTVCQILQLLVSQVFVHFLAIHLRLEKETLLGDIAAVLVLELARNLVVLARQGIL